MRLSACKDEGGCAQACVQACSRTMMCVSMYTDVQGYRHVKGKETSQSKVKETNGKGKSKKGEGNKGNGNSSKDDV